MKTGSLFSGYCGLDSAVNEVFGSETAWHSEIDKGACKILAHRFPDVPNHGDITRIDWSAVEPVDILTGGSPCQDLSHAGKRQGMTGGTRSNLWVAMREAIAALRPGLIVWENVRGAYSAEASSELESDPRLLDRVRRRDGEPVLRALGRVLGDLARLGYDAQWHGLRAADVGAPHGRFRVFVVAYPTGNAGRFQHGDGESAAYPQRGGLDGWAPVAQRGSLARVAAAGSGEGALLPSPRTSDTNGAGQHGEGGLDLRTAVAMLPTPRATDGTKGGPNQRGSSGDLMLPSAVTHLLPTPAVNDMGEGKTPEAGEEGTAKMKAAHGNGNGHGASLSIEAQRLAVPSSCTCGLDDDPEWPLPEDMWGNHDLNCPAHQRLLPTPTAGSRDRNETEITNRRENRSNGLNLDEIRLTEWGQYAAAIARWETLTRPAPPPTELGPKGNPRLSAAFSEWLMGLPAGWVTDVPGITRNEALKALGNGVVPAQAAAALRLMLGVEVAA